MNLQIALIMAGAAVLAFSTTILVRRRLLSIRYGLGWLAISVVGFVGAPVLAAIASLVEGSLFTATGFSAGVFIVFLGLVCLQLSISVSGLHSAVQDLAEYAALVEARVGALEAERDEAKDDAAEAAARGRESVS